MEIKNKVYNYLQSLGISYDVLDHEAIFTMEEGTKVWEKLDGMHCKNLFFRNKKGNQHFLVVLDGRKQLNIKDLESKLEEGRLSFASKERLDKHLKLTPGSVTPFGLINNLANDVKVILDQDIKNEDKVNFHPNINTATITISTKDFHKYLEEVGNQFNYISL